MFDIWHSILSIPEAFTTTELLDLQFTSRNFLTAIRPLIFRHINLVDEDRGRGFVEAVTSSNFDTTISTKYTRAFQLSFSPSGSDDEITEFWILVGRALESMTSLKSLNLCFAHGDENFAEYLGYLIQQLPTDTVRKLHLLPIPEETVLSVSSQHPSYPISDLNAYTTDIFRFSLSRAVESPQLARCSGKFRSHLFFGHLDPHPLNMASPRPASRSNYRTMDISFPKFFFGPYFILLCIPGGTGGRHLYA